MLGSSGRPAAALPHSERPLNCRQMQTQSNLPLPRFIGARGEETDGATETVNGFDDPAHLWSLDEIGPWITASVPVQEMETSIPTSLPSCPFLALRRRQHMAARCFEDLFRLAQDFQSSANPPAGSGTSVRESFPRPPRTFSPSADPPAEDLDISPALF